MTGALVNFLLTVFYYFMMIELRKSKRLFLSSLMLLFMTAGLFSQEPGDLRLLDWKPKSMLVVKETQVVMPKYPVIDFHNHLRRLENTETYLEEMDKAGVWITVSLDGGQENDFYREHLRVSNSVSRDRFLVFFRPDFSRID